MMTTKPTTPPRTRAWLPAATALLVAAATLALAVQTAHGEDEDVVELAAAQPDPGADDEVPTLDDDEFEELFGEETSPETPPDAPQGDDGDPLTDLAGDILDALNFAGTIQLDYLYVPTDDRARDLSFDGFTTELSLKLSADITEHVSVQVKTCFACHGFELGAAHVDVRPWPALRLRAGKFVPRFGDFPVRHDPANHLTSDKPLPYDMGRMLRLREWNMSILPAPYVDNGFEVSVRHDLGTERVQADYAAYVIGGLRGSNEAVDVDFIQSRSPELYYVDNNSEPAVGGRLAISSRLSDDVMLTVGGSGMWGHYDPDRELDYLIAGGDLVLRLWAVTLRTEYLFRRTRMALGANPEDIFQYGPGADGTFDPYHFKDGFYAEVDFPVWPDHIEGVARVDGMRRLGNVLQGTPLRAESAILRYTAALNYVFARRQVRIKLSGEFYDFSDFSDEVATHLGLVATF